MENVKEPEKSQKPQGKQSPKAELHIVLTPQGVAVAGAVKDEMLSLFLLEKAKDIIKQINAPEKVKPKNRVFGAFGKKG